MRVRFTSLENDFQCPIKFTWERLYIVIQFIGKD